MFVLFGAIQFFTQMTSPILWAMMSDTVDYGEHKTGRRITGLVFSGALFCLKLGMALGGALLGWVLAYYGYRGGTEVQTPEAIRGIVITFTLVPALFHFLVIPIASHYTLSDARHDVIRAELDRADSEDLIAVVRTDLVQYGLMLVGLPGIALASVLGACGAGTCFSYRCGRPDALLFFLVSLAFAASTITSSPVSSAPNERA